MRPDRDLRPRRQRGFTLAELAIGFLIIGLLLAGAFMPLSSQIEVRNTADTRRTMDQIKEALIGFAQSNGRLPCPARGATAAGTTDSSWGAAIAAGVEQYNTATKSCYIALGVVPWSTLGITETDAWGRRMTYRVAPAFADDTTLTTWNSRLSAPGGSQSRALPSPYSPADQSPACPSTGASNAPTPTPTLSSFALCTLGDIAVLTRSDSDHSVVTPLGTGLPAVIVSHGRNGNGAWQPTGIQLVAAAASSDELVNSGGTTTATPSGGYLSYVFYSRNYSPSATGCSDTSGTLFCEFDDIVAMISTNTLVARMISAGRLP